MLERAIISGVAHTTNETVYRVDGVPAARLFSALADAGVNVDTILQTAGEIVLSAPTDAAAETSHVLDQLGGSWTSDGELGKVSVVGAGMKSHPAVTATAFGTLRDEGIEPVIVTTSPIKITAHVKREDAERAVAALQRAFGVGAEAAADA